MDHIYGNQIQYYNDLHMQLPEAVVLTLLRQILQIFLMRIRSVSEVSLNMLIML